MTPVLQGWLCRTQPLGAVSEEEGMSPGTWGFSVWRRSWGHLVRVLSSQKGGHESNWGQPWPSILSAQLLSPKCGGPERSPRAPSPAPAARGRAHVYVSHLHVLWSRGLDLWLSPLEELTASGGFPLLPLPMGRGWICTSEVVKSAQPALCAWGRSCPLSGPEATGSAQQDWQAGLVPGTHPRWPSGLQNPQPPTTGRTKGRW